MTKIPGSPRDGAGAPSPLRLAQILLRTAHILGMGLVLGGLQQGAGYTALWSAIWLTVGSGTLLFALDLLKDPRVLQQGFGVAVLLKLALLGLGHTFPDHRLSFYLAATALASFSSHMPGAWRHAILLGPTGSA